MSSEGLRPISVLLLSVLLGLSGCGGTRESLIISEFNSQTTCEGNLRGTPHTGIDVRASYGDPVIAAADGVVAFAGTFPVRYGTGAWCGTTVAIDHMFGPAGEARTLYCHLSATTVAAGATVNRGDLIGSVGTTGFISSGGALPHCMHVHFELRRVSASMPVEIGRGSDPMPLVVGCFDRQRSYPAGRLELTWPVKC